MHDTDLFAQPPSMRDAAGYSPAEGLLHTFDEVREVSFKDETYLVRDNGAVFRKPRVGSKRRKLDEVWTFGNLSRSTGYLMVSDHVVHQIVTAAFHGARPSPEHVVDHIDTNRQNNRAENLRWVTRLENVLLNPITRRRIELAFGSLEAFFENPRANSVPDWDWMRTVTREEAQASLERLLEWAEQGKVTGDGSLGSWLFAKTPAAAAAPEPVERDTPSLTPSAFQRDWRTPTAFPLCPKEVNADALDDYAEQLEFGAVFARNQYGESIVVVAETGREKPVLSVLCRTESGVKDWAFAKVYIEEGRFCHESGGTFFTLQGALKRHCEALGEPLAESIDDYS